uniref:E4 protein n=1 Tax=Human papillomavirus TaxID=10566 RepID=A0A385PLB6_9PAPI|nr:MAG: E4 protein [Human papillomavirus]
MKLFLPLSPVPTGRHPYHPKPPSVPPATPYPQRKPAVPDDNKVKREALAAQPPFRRRLVYDDDEDKENTTPTTESPQDRREEDRHQLLGSLLQKWAYDIEVFQQQVLQDLQDLKLKLGIRPLSL